MTLIWPQLASIFRPSIFDGLCSFGVSGDVMGLQNGRKLSAATPQHAHDPRVSQEPASAFLSRFISYLHSTAPAALRHLRTCSGRTRRDDARAFARVPGPRLRSTRPVQQRLAFIVAQAHGGIRRPVRISFSFIIDTQTADYLLFEL